MWPYHLFFLLISVCFSSSFSQDGSTGNGYMLNSVNVDPSGKSLTAKLQLISSTLTYGPDIQNLNLLAR